MKVYLVYENSRRGYVRHVCGNENYAEGLIKENGKNLIVSRGIGTSILPIRFNCFPEIVIIKFE